MTQLRAMLHLISVVALGAALLAPGAAEAALTRTGTPTVQFTAVGPAGLTIVGTTHELDVRETETGVTVAVSLANLDTGIALRNRHMREKYLEVDKYPRAELSVARSDVRVPAAGAATSGDVDGTMVIHGVSRPVRLAYKARRDERGIHVTGSVHVNIKEHGIQVPSYLGVTVKPDVDVTLSFDVGE
jgi:polyisoprenoid-binding protein YceI